jgi:hypothetical protein
MNSLNNPSHLQVIDIKTASDIVSLPDDGNEGGGRPLNRSECPEGAGMCDDLCGYNARY